jgi:hypothetical protein
LDGLKVIKWNVGVWLIVFAVSVAMMLLSIIIGVENMVMMIITLNP